MVAAQLTARDRANGRRHGHTSLQSHLSARLHQIRSCRRSWGNGACGYGTVLSCHCSPRGDGATTAWPVVTFKLKKIRKSWPWPWQYAFEFEFGGRRARPAHPSAPLRAARGRLVSSPPLFVSIPCSSRKRKQKPCTRHVQCHVQLQVPSRSTSTLMDHPCMPMGFPEAAYSVAVHGTLTTNPCLF